MAVNNNATKDNTGGAVIFGTFDYGDEALIPNTTYMAQGSGAPSMLSLRGLPIRSLPITNSFAEAFTILTAGVLEEVLESDVWANAKTQCNNSVYWLWGSLDAGGCYVRRESNEFYRIGGVSGFYKNNNTNEYSYVITESARPYNYATCDDICFMYDADWLGAPQPTIHVFCTDGLTQYYVWEQIYDYDLSTGAMELHPLTNMSEVANNTNWTFYPTMLRYGPNVWWFARQNMTAPYNLDYEILGDRGQTNVTKISGDIWGGQEFDPAEEDDPNDKGGDSGQGGGNGGYNNQTGGVGNSNPAGDTVNVVNSGFVTLYNPTTAQVREFNTWLFSEASFTSILSNTVKRLVANPMDFVLFLALCRVTPPSAYQEVIKFAGINTNITAKLINNQFCSVNCGSITVNDNELTGTFLDYNPNTKIEMFLPYIGVVQLDTDTIIKSTVNVTYQCDLMSGSCVAQVKCSRGIRRKGDTNLNDVIYTYQGNIFEMVPLTSTDWRGATSSLIQAIGGGLQMASGNAGGVSTIASAVLSDKVSVSHSGSLAGSYGYMDNQKPYLIITRPINANPSEYGKWRGYTSNIMRQLGSVSGYTEILPESIWTDNFASILQEEADMLKSICSNGIYV